MTTRCLFTIVLALTSFACGGPGASQPPPLSITTASLSNGFVGFPYSQTVEASGGMPPFSWTVSSGTLPQNLVLAIQSSGTATISGTPIVAQNSVAFGIEVTDARNQVATRSNAINVEPTAVAQLQEVHI